MMNLIVILSLSCLLSLSINPLNSLILKGVELYKKDPQHFISMQKRLVFVICVAIFSKIISYCIQSLINVEVEMGEFFDIHNKLTSLIEFNAVMLGSVAFPILIFTIIVRVLANN